MGIYFRGLRTTYLLKSVLPKISRVEKFVYQCCQRKYLPIENIHVYGISLFNIIGNFANVKVTLSCSLFVALYLPFDRLKYRVDKWDPAFRQYLKSLDDKKPVILCGDLNVAHHPIGKRSCQLK